MPSFIVSFKTGGNVVFMSSSSMYCCTVVLYVCNYAGTRQSAGAGAPDTSLQPVSLLYVWDVTTLQSAPTISTLQHHTFTRLSTGSTNTASTETGFAFCVLLIG